MGRETNTRLVYSTEGKLPREPAAAERPSKGSRGIRLRLDKRASGRLVTVVSGLPGSRAEVATLARNLKALCAAGGSVKDGQLELQGDHRATVEQALAARGLRSRRGGKG